jgi:hypothetical protein
MWWHRAHEVHIQQQVYGVGLYPGRPGTQCMRIALSSTGSSRHMVSPRGADTQRNPISRPQTSSQPGKCFHHPSWALHDISAAERQTKHFPPSINIREARLIWLMMTWKAEWHPHPLMHLTIPTHGTSTSPTLSHRHCHPAIMPFAGVFVPLVCLLLLSSNQNLTCEEYLHFPRRFALRLSQGTPRWLLTPIPLEKKPKQAWINGMLLLNEAFVLIQVDTTDPLLRI